MLVITDTGLQNSMLKLCRRCAGLLFCYLMYRATWEYFSWSSVVVAFNILMLHVVAVLSAYTQERITVT